MRPNGTPQQLERRRRRAIALIRAGESCRDVAKQLKASLSSIVRWNQAYRKEGSKGLKPKPASGRPSFLTASQKQRLKKYLLQGAQAAGYSNDLWTLKRVGKLIEQEFGVHYCLPAVWHLLVGGLGWSAPKPERRATQRDEATIARWKRTVWPRIKKSPKTGRAPGLSGRKRISAHPQRA